MDNEKEISWKCGYFDCYEKTVCFKVGSRQLNKKDNGIKFDPRYPNLTTMQILIPT